MGKPLKGINNTGGDASASLSPVGMSRLDLAKMTVESLTKMMERRVHDHNLKLQSDISPFKSLHNLGFGYSPSDQFLLLSTGCQHSSQSNSAACGAGGRLLVGFGPKDHRNDPNAADQLHLQMHTQKNEFDHELKRLKATEWETGEQSFPEDGGGAMGLNAALSTAIVSPKEELKICVQVPMGARVGSMMYAPVPGDSSRVLEIRIPSRKVRKFYVGYTMEQTILRSDVPGGERGQKQNWHDNRLAVMAPIFF